MEYCSGLCLRDLYCSTLKSDPENFSLLWMSPDFCFWTNRAFEACRGYSIDLSGSTECVVSISIQRW